MTTVGFPIYDCHGSMTACLFRSGTTYYSLGNQRHYDAWGVIRSGANSGDPKGRYCANLGHEQDDESGLVYMRARYFEPTSGRFLSEDPDRVRGNWLTYGSGDPINRVDATGRDDELVFAVLIWISTMVAKDLSSQLWAVVKPAILKLMALTASIVGNQLMALSMSLIEAGRANLQAASASIEAAGLSEGLAGAFGAAASGIAQGFLGAGELSLGITLYYCADIIIGLGDIAGGP